MAFYNLLSRDNPSATGNRIKSLRMLIGCTRKEFAEKTGISENTLKIWEEPAETRNGISKKGANRLIAAMKDCGITCTLEWLLFGLGYGPSLQHIQKEDLPQNHEEVSWGEEESIFRDIESFKANNPNPIVIAITDGSLLPCYSYGDYVGGSKMFGKNIELLANSLCIVEFNENILVRKISEPNNQGKYTLSAMSSDVLSTHSTFNNVDLNFAAKIIWHRSRLFTKYIVV